MSPRSFRISAGWITWCVLLFVVTSATQLQAQGSAPAIPGWEGSTRLTIGRTDAGEPLDAILDSGFFELTKSRAATSVVLIAVPAPSSPADALEQFKQVATFRQALKNYQVLPLHFVCVTLPEGTRFPPSGTGYNTAGQRTATALWRSLAWLGIDVVIEFRNSESPAWSEHSLANAAKSKDIVGYGSIATIQLPLSLLQVPIQEWTADQMESSGFSKIFTRGPTHSPLAIHQEARRRRNLSPVEVAQQLDRAYGHDLKKVMYQPALALVARLRLAEITKDKRTSPEIANILKPYLEQSSAKVDGNGSVVSGHLVFADWALRTRDPRAIELVRQAAAVGFDSQGKPLLAMPSHNEMSDAVFMGCPILSSAARLTGETKYLDELSLHFQHMRKLCLRDDGLYRHSPLCEAAWGRGNGFPMLGLALTLTDLQAIQQDNAASPELKSQTKELFNLLLPEFRHLASALLPHQDVTGMWRQVIDEPSAYREFTATCMIGFALQRGLKNGWLDSATFQQPVDHAWEAVKTRIGADGGLLDVCTGTGKQKSLQDYFDRTAVLGIDERGGAMGLLFAVERCQ